MREGHLILVFFVVVIAATAVIDHRASALELAMDKTQSYDENIEEALEESYIMYNNYVVKKGEGLSLQPSDIIKRQDNGENIYDEDSIKGIRNYFYKALASKYSLDDSMLQKMFQAAPIIVFVDTNCFYVSYYNGGLNLQRYYYRFSNGGEVETLDTSNYTKVWDLVDKTLTYYVNQYGNGGTAMKNGVLASLDTKISTTENNWDDLAGTYVFFYREGSHDKYSSKYTFSRLISKKVSSMHAYWIEPNKSSGLPEYHVSGGCCINDNVEKYYNSARECAEEGAYPCNKCLGVTISTEGS